MLFLFKLVSYLLEKLKEEKIFIFICIIPFSTLIYLCRHKFLPVIIFFMPEELSLHLVVFRSLSKELSVFLCLEKTNKQVFISLSFLEDNFTEHRIQI